MVVKDKSPKYINILLAFWGALLIVIYMLTITTSTSTKDRYYEIMESASQKAELAFQKIKEKKQELGLSLSSEDKYQSGMLGPLHSKIQTTEGDPAAKRTSTNPNFAAIYIKMFKEANLKSGDEIAIVTSGSFPALNISATIAAQEYGLKFISMTGIGASSYGATDISFTYFDMANYLYELGIYENKLDYVSFGGAYDDGSEFPDDVREELMLRINSSAVKFISESDFKKNIQKRIEYIEEKCPNLKLFLNVGGTIVSMGNGYTNAVNYRGLVKPNYLTLNKSSTDLDHKGLLETYLEKGIPIIQMLNITKIAYEYGLPQDPAGIPAVGVGDVYFETKYYIAIPIMGIVISIVMLSFYFIVRKKYNL